MHADSFEPTDYWRAIILYGLNNATYKIALGKTLLLLAQQGETTVNWSTLSKTYLDEYRSRLANNPLPQQANPSRLTVMEQIVRSLVNERISYDEAIQQVAQQAFNDVVPRFQTVGTNKQLVAGLFYDFLPGKQLVIHDSIFDVIQSGKDPLMDELEARWSLLEGAFTIRKESHVKNLQLTNDLRQIYLSRGYTRQNITSNIPFLQGYQGATCFYCGEPVLPGDIHVDHVLPRQVVHHDEIWNLVLAHKECNMSKSDRLVGKHYIEKLIYRNENIMGSNHPWKQKIELTLGNSSLKRRRQMEQHYENVKSVLGAYYWGGLETYHPEFDPFYRRLITRLNNG
jgi:5-methylcytosine-specific restriction endonuclease McrA